MSLKNDYRMPGERILLRGGVDRHRTSAILRYLYIKAEELEAKYKAKYYYGSKVELG